MSPRYFDNNVGVAVEFCQYEDGYADGASNVANETIGLRPVRKIKM